MLFSISMPNYNKDKWIKQAISSVLNQTFKNFELIIVDDNSTDNSLNIIKSFSDERIKLIKNEKNYGVSYANKVAFEESKGELIGIIDSDDYLVPIGLESMVMFANENPGCGFLYSNYEHCDKNLNHIRLGPNHYPIKNGSIIYDKDAVSHFKVFRKTAYNKSAKFDINFIKAADRDITLKMEEVTNFAYLPLALYKWRYHGEGISQSKNGKKALEYFYKAVDDAQKRRNK